MTKNVENISDLENDTRQEGIIENKWENISRLYHGQIMQIFELDILGRCDIDKETNWCN